MPTSAAPLLANAVAIAIHAGVGAYLASGALAGVLPDRRVRVALGLGFVLLPAIDDNTGHIFNAQWNLAVFIAASSLAARIGPGGRISLAVAGLTGPFAILFAPLHWARSRRTGDWVPSAILTAAAGAQVVAMLASPRASLDTVRSGRARVADRGDARRHRARDRGEVSSRSRSD